MLLCMKEALFRFTFLIYFPWEYNVKFEEYNVILLNKTEAWEYLLFCQANGTYLPLLLTLWISNIHNIISYNSPNSLVYIVCMYNVYCTYIIISLKRLYGNSSWSGEKQGKFPPSPWRSRFLSLRDNVAEPHHLCSTLALAPNPFFENQK